MKKGLHSSLVSEFTQPSIAHHDSFYISLHPLVVYEGGMYMFIFTVCQRTFHTDCTYS